MGWTYKPRFLLKLSSQNTLFCLIRRSRRASTRYIQRDVVFSSIVSTVNTRNAWDHEPPFGDQERLAGFHKKVPNVWQSSTLILTVKTRAKSFERRYFPGALLAGFSLLTCKNLLIHLYDYNITLEVSSYLKCRKHWDTKRANWLDFRCHCELESSS